MSLYRPGKWLIGLVSLAIVPVVHAGPTASMWDGDVLSRPSCSNARSDSLSPASPDIEQITAVCKSHIANIGAELLKPPADSPLSATSSLPAAATSLPPIPGALFMALAGFLCVSLVRDRKLWMAALAGLLWAGQAGVTVLPQVAHHLASRKHAEQAFVSSIAYRPGPENSDRPRSDIEGTQYIGLLYHLAGIPDGSLLSTSLRAQRSNLRNQRNTQYAIRHTTKLPQFALSRLYAYILSATKRLAYITKQHACFSPAFIFQNLARGPPPQTWMRFFLLCNFELHSVFANTLITLR